MQLLRRTLRYDNFLVCFSFSSGFTSPVSICDIIKRPLMVFLIVSRRVTKAFEGSPRLTTSRPGPLFLYPRFLTSQHRGSDLCFPAVFGSSARCLGPHLIFRYFCMSTDSEISHRRGACGWKLNTHPRVAGSLASGSKAVSSPETRVYRKKNNHITRFLMQGIAMRSAVNARTNSSPDHPGQFW
jgi:hypothetical protein